MPWACDICNEPMGHGQSDARFKQACSVKCQQEMVNAAVQEERKACLTVLDGFGCLSYDCCGDDSPNSCVVCRVKTRINNR